MSLAWQISEEDVEQVLITHDSKRASDECLLNYIDFEIKRIEDAVLYYTDFDDQCAAALCEIEDILLEQGILSGEKMFLPPGGAA